MNRIIILTTVFILATSCLSRKTTHKHTDLSSASKKAEIMTEARWLYRLQERDSNQIVWQFQTDAPFFYNPDSGLFAERGDLTFAMQSAYWRQVLQDSNDRLIYMQDDQQRNEALTTLTERRSSNQKVVWWVVCVLLVIGAAIYHIAYYR